MASDAKVVVGVVMVGVVMKYLCAIALAAMGMVGLYMHIEYSGWALAAGLLVPFLA